jgi:hypothetical protein
LQAKPIIKPTRCIKRDDRKVTIGSGSPLHRERVVRCSDAIENVEDGIRRLSGAPAILSGGDCSRNVPEFADREHQGFAVR